MNHTLIRLQDERKEIMRKYRQHEIPSREAIRLLRVNDDAKKKNQKKKKG